MTYVNALCQGEALKGRGMTERKPDPELWALIVALHDHCRSRDIELATAARFLGDTSVIVARVGSDEAVIGLLDQVRTSLTMDGPDEAKGSGALLH